MIRAHTLRWQLTTAAILFTLSFLHLTADKHEPLLSMTVPPNELDIQIPASALVDETVTIEINYTGVSQVDVTLNFGDGSPSEIVTLAGNGTIPNGTLPNATTTITHLFTAAGLYTVTGSIDTTSSDSAVIEILAPTPEATPEATQTPGVDDTPGPQDTDTPEPEETKTLSPEDTATPKPEETPDPAMTETPKPTGTITPKPEESDTPTSEPSKTPMTPVDGNHNPVAVNDNVSTKKGEAIKIAVLGNDTDIDEDELSIESVTSPQNGDATNNATFVIYTPDDGFVGSDKLSYVVADGNGGSDTGQVFVNVLEQVESAICEPDQETTIEVNDDVETDDDFRQSYSIAVSILIESGSVSQETRINYGRVQSEQRTEADFDEERLSGFKFTAFAFMLEALVDEFIQTNFRFNKPIRISITYEEIAINGLDESTLTFVYYHTAEDRWSDSGINVVERNTETNTLTIEVDHLTEFALVAQESPTSLETTDEPTGRPDSMFLPFVLP